MTITTTTTTTITTTTIFTIFVVVGVVNTITTPSYNYINYLYREGNCFILSEPWPIIFDLNYLIQGIPPNIFIKWL